MFEAAASIAAFALPALRSDVRHKQEIARTRELHAAEAEHSCALLSEKLMHKSRLYSVESTFATRRHALNMEVAHSLSRREALRDAWSQRTWFLQTMILVVALIFSVVFIALTQGRVADVAKVQFTLAVSELDSAEEVGVKESVARTFGVDLWMFSTGLSIGSLLVALWMCLIIQKRIGRYRVLPSLADAGSHGTVVSKGDVPHSVVGSVIGHDAAAVVGGDDNDVMNNNNNHNNAAAMRPDESNSVQADRASSPAGSPANQLLTPTYTNRPSSGGAVDVHDDGEHQVLHEPQQQEQINDIGNPAAAATAGNAQQVREEDNESVLSRDSSVLSSMNMKTTNDDGLPLDAVAKLEGGRAVVDAEVASVVDFVMMTSGTGSASSLVFESDPPPLVVRHHVTSGPAGGNPNPAAAAVAADAGMPNNTSTSLPVSPTRRLNMPTQLNVSSISQQQPVVGDDGNHQKTQELPASNKHLNVATHLRTPSPNNRNSNPHFSTPTRRESVVMINPDAIRRRLMHVPTALENIDGRGDGGADEVDPDDSRSVIVERRRERRKSAAAAKKKEKKRRKEAEEEEGAARSPDIVLDEKQQQQQNQQQNATKQPSPTVGSRKKSSSKNKKKKLAAADDDGVGVEGGDDLRQVEEAHRQEQAAKQAQVDARNAGRTFFLYNCGKTHKSFNSYYLCHCEPLRKLATYLLAMGTCAALVAGAAIYAMLMGDVFRHGYSAYFAIGLVVAGVLGVAWASWYSPDDLIPTVEKADDFFGLSREQADASRAPFGGE